MPPLSVPTSAALPSSQLLPSTNPAVSKILNRLTRPSLISLALDWLDPRNQENIVTCLAPQEQEEEDDENDPYPPARSLRELREVYLSLQSSKGSKRDVVDRIIEGDWREGISLYQLAMADMQYLYDHPSSQKWSALKVVKIDLESKTKPNKLTPIPRFHPSTFLRNLQRENLPDVKAHYNLDRHTTLPMLILRIFILESPYNTNQALHSTAQLGSSRTFYVAFPDASPYIYVSLTTTTGPASTTSEARSLRKLTLDGIPKAFSRPRERYTLESTSLSARNLEALVKMRGGGRTNTAGGGWGIYAEDNKQDTPIHPTPYDYKPVIAEEAPEEDASTKPTGMKRRRLDSPTTIKRRKVLARSRFGNSGLSNDGKGIERLDVRVEDAFPSSSAICLSPSDSSPDSSEPRNRKKKGRRSTISLELDKHPTEVEEEIEDAVWRPDVRFTFQGQHIFAGIRKLLEEGVIGGEKMPGWMTGEEGISVGVVRHGRIKGWKGSGV